MEWATAVRETDRVGLKFERGGRGAREGDAVVDFVRDEAHATLGAEVTDPPKLFGAQHSPCRTTSEKRGGVKKL